MDEAPKKFAFAWQPLTAKGVAAFAHAPLARLLVMQFIFAAVAAAAVVWCLAADWFPVINEAIRQLPKEAVIRSGSLQWKGEKPDELAENRFLALVVDLNHQGKMRSPSHVCLEFGRTDLKAISLLGYVQWPYPHGRTIAFNRQELEPWWGAWTPAILALVAAVVVVSLMLAWGLLATIYCWSAWVLAFFANRDLDLRGSWRLAGAACLPGALFFSAAIFFYSLGVLDPVRLAAAAAVHPMIAWVYLVISPLRLPPHPAVHAKNPFAPQKQTSAT